MESSAFAFDGLVLSLFTQYAHEPWSLANFSVSLHGIGGVGGLSTFTVQSLAHWNGVIVVSYEALAMNSLFETLSHIPHFHFQVFQKNMHWIVAI